MSSVQTFFEEGGIKNASPERADFAELRGAAIEIKGLTKYYGKVKAVDGISLTVKEGEVFALLGENGAGKTTTIKVLCTLAGFNEGTVRVCGKDVSALGGEVRKIINVSPQETAVAKKLTVKENLVLAAELYGMSEPQKRAEELIKEFKLCEEAGRLACKLSGGQQRKLSLAMALISEPRVLFLDEPTLGLDVRARRELWKEIERLKGKMTVILTTHYLEEAESLADRAAIMKKGKILACGTAEEIKAAAGESSFEEAFLKLTGEDYAQD